MKKNPRKTPPATVEDLAILVAAEFARLHERLDGVERRFDGQFRQVFLTLASMQSQLNSIETDVRAVKRDVAELYKVAP